MAATAGHTVTSALAGSSDTFPTTFDFSHAAESAIVMKGLNADQTSPTTAEMICIPTQKMM